MSGKTRRSTRNTAAEAAAAAEAEAAAAAAAAAKAKAAGKTSKKRKQKTSKAGVTKKKVRDTRPENLYNTVKKIHLKEHGGRGKKLLDSLATSAVAGIAVENARKFAKYAHRMAQQSKKITVMPRHIQAAINMVVHNEEARKKINGIIQKANLKVNEIIEGTAEGSIQKNLKKEDGGVKLVVSIRKMRRLMRQECGTLRVSVRSAVICAVAVDQIIKNILSAGHADFGETMNGFPVTEEMKKKKTLTLSVLHLKVQENKKLSSFVSAGGVVGGAPPVAKRLFWADKLTDAQIADKAAKKKKSKKKSDTKTVRQHKSATKRAKKKSEQQAKESEKSKQNAKESESEQSSSEENSSDNEDAWITQSSKGS